MNGKDEELLIEIARQAMIDNGLKPDFDDAVLQQVENMNAAVGIGDPAIRDLRQLQWCSIDNDDSRDLDQLTWGEAQDEDLRVLVAVADVDALVPKGTPVDLRAQHNTTSVYTPARVFPMLPERLSTDLTSMNEHVDRLAIVVDMTVRPDGSNVRSEVYRALVRNHARLVYEEVAAWLDGERDAPSALTAVEGLAESVRLQDRAADAMRAMRHENGALNLDTVEARPVIRDGVVVEMRPQQRNNARLLIEDFMIAANGATARFLVQHGFASIRRVVRSPRRWDRMEKIAGELGERLPPEPDARALEQFLARRKKADPASFADLSLSIVKAMGAGEYVVEEPGEQAIGHFGLAVKDYTHSTAPNRRYPDLITHRLVKAALAGAPMPYTVEELAELAAHCTKQENAANKVERVARKAAAASLLATRVGRTFDSVVTGASSKGTWVRILSPAAEGKLVRGSEGLDIGDRVRVRLTGVDVERGHIDFAR